MKKGKFVSGVVLSAISVLFGALASLLLMVSLNAHDIGGAVLAVLMLPVAFICYAVQAVTGCVGEGLLWGNYRRGEVAKKASLVVAIIEIVILSASAAIVACAFILRG